MTDTNQKLREALQAYQDANEMSPYGDYSKIEWESSAGPVNPSWGGGDCKKHGRWYGRCYSCSDEWDNLRKMADRDAYTVRENALNAAKQMARQALALPTAEQVDDINVAESFTSVTKTAAPAQGEPFGYFRAEPFGWTDCPEDAEGAIALYEHPAKPAQEVGLTDDEIDENTVWHDPDPHDNVHCDVSATVRKCLAAIRAKGGK